MKYAYFPGCSLTSTATEYNMSTRAVSKSLDIELVEIPDWICCGATPAHSTSHLLSIALPVKSLVQAKEMDLEVVTCCAACFSRLKVANNVMKSNEEDRDKVNQIVNADYEGEIKVRHLLDVLVNKYDLDGLKSKVKTELTDLKVASYYGCLLTRPPDIMDFDDPEEPKSMDNLMAAIGAQPLEWPYKTECCGASLAISRPDIVMKLTFDILKMAKDAGAECIAVACPLCQSNLDLYQGDIERKYDTEFNLPVFYFTQLVGLSLGIEPERLGIEKNTVDPWTLLETRRLV